MHAPVSSREGVGYFRVNYLIYFLHEMSIDFFPPREMHDLLRSHELPFSIFSTLSRAFYFVVKCEF